MQIKKYLTAAVAAASVAAAAAPASASAFYVKPCGGGSQYTRTWAGARTSCGMARAAQRAYSAICENSGECSLRFSATSPVTGRTYRFRYAGQYHHGSTPLGKFVARGDHGSQVTAFFWIP